jgi:hypothetical protein
MSEASTDYVEAEAGTESEAWPFDSEAAPGEAGEAQYGEASSRDRRLQMLRARQQAQRRRPSTLSRPQPARAQARSVTSRRTSFRSTSIRGRP